jgi:hypothetical protein
MAKSFELTCPECGAKYTCKWCGGTHFIEVTAGTMCVSCSTLTASGNADFEHDYSKHRTYECWECGKKYYSEYSLSNHMFNEHYILY